MKVRRFVHTSQSASREEEAAFDRDLADLLDDEKTPVSCVDLRDTVRVPLDLPSSLRVDAASRVPRIAARTLDVSAGGARVTTSAPLEQGARVRHLLCFPGEADSSPLAAHVIWLRPRHGESEIGLEFDDVPASVRERIEELVDRRFRDVHRLTLLLVRGTLDDVRRRRELNDLLRRLGLPGDASESEMRTWTQHTQALFEQGRWRLQAGARASGHSDA